MFNIGDKVVYPMHGAGTVAKIEEKELNGQLVQYLVLQMIVSDMTIMIPVNKAELVGLRKVGNKRMLADVEEILKSDEPANEPTMNWNKRSNMYLEQLKTSDMQKVAKVVQTLMQKERTKKISTGERRILNTGKQILLSELAIICGKNYDDMQVWLDKIMN